MLKRPSSIKAVIVRELFFLKKLGGQSHYYLIDLGAVKLDCSEKTRLFLVKLFVNVVWYNSDRHCCFPSHSGKYAWISLAV